MSQADELLMSLDEDVVETTTGNIVVGMDRFITVPDSLKKIAVQYDHDIETVTFDCPRYWDEHDLSQMRVYVNYMRADGVFGCHLCSNVVVDTADESIMHFDWTVSGHVTYVSGTITFLICVKNVDADGNEENIWHTEINSDMYVSTGMKCHDTILRRYPDIITQLLYRMDQSEAYIQGITVEAHALDTSEEATITKTETENSINLNFGLPRGKTGEQGIQGDIGISISSIKLTAGNHAPGTLDTYTITLSDGSTTTFQVYNGLNGEGTGDMLASVYDPQGKYQDVFGYVDTAIQNLNTSIRSTYDPQGKNQDIFAYIDTVDIDAGEW